MVIWRTEPPHYAYALVALATRLPLSAFEGCRPYKRAFGVSGLSPDRDDQRWHHLLPKTTIGQTHTFSGPKYPPAIRAHRNQRLRGQRGSCVSSLLPILAPDLQRATECVIISLDRCAFSDPPARRDQPRCRSAKRPPPCFQGSQPAPATGSSVAIIFDRTRHRRKLRTRPPIGCWLSPRRPPIVFCRGQSGSPTSCCAGRIHGTPLPWNFCQSPKFNPF
jgi:hypothetical protein